MIVEFQVRLFLMVLVMMILSGFILFLVCVMDMVSGIEVVEVLLWFCMVIIMCFIGMFIFLVMFLMMWMLV